MIKTVLQKIRASVVLVPALMGLLAGPLVMTIPAQAASPVQSVCQGANGATGTSGSTCNDTQLNGFIRNIVNIMLFVIGAIAVIMIIVGGIRYVVSNGDQSQITAAKNTILYAIVGLVIAVLAYAIVGFVLNSLNAK